MSDYEMNIGNLNDGKVLEALEDSLKKIVNNILDPNTDPEQKRKIKLLLTFEPSIDRTHVIVHAKVEPTLAAVPASTGAVHINRSEKTAYIRDTRQDELFAQAAPVSGHKN